MKERDYLIDLLRFLAAFWVAVFHFNEPILYIDNWYRNFVKLGHLGVPIFFAISGYCIILTATKAKGAIDFLGRRIFRIFPAYWFSLLLVLGVVVIQKILTGNNSVTVLPKSIIDIGAVMSLLTDPFSTIGTINWVYWSLTYEIFFYMVVAVCLAFPDKLRPPYLLVISVLAMILPTFVHGPLFFLQHWPIFALGLSVYIFKYKPYPLSKVFSVCIILVNLIALIKGCLLTNHTANFITSIVGVLLIIVSPYLKMRNNIFSKLGDYSYAVYLIHVPIGIYLIGMLKSPSIQQNVLFNVIFDMVTYVIISCLAYLMFKYIENPGIQYGRRLMATKSKQLRPIEPERS